MPVLQLSTGAVPRRGYFYVDQTNSDLLMSKFDFNGEDTRGYIENLIDCVVAVYPININAGDKFMQITFDSPLVVDQGDYYKVDYDSITVSADFPQPGANYRFDIVSGASVASLIDIGDLGNVDTGANTANDGHALVFNETTSTWENKFKADGCIPYKFDDTQTTSPVPAEFIRLNNSDPALATQVYISFFDGNNVNVLNSQLGFYTQLDNFFRILSPTQGEITHLYKITGSATDNPNNQIILNVVYNGGAGSVAGVKHLILCREPAFKLDDLRDVNYPTGLADGEVLTFNIATSKWENKVPVGGGEVNTASNLASEGLFAQKNGVDLEFKGLTSTDNSVTITSTATTVDLKAEGGMLVDTQTNILALNQLGEFGITNDQTPNTTWYYNGTEPRRFVSQGQGGLFTYSDLDSTGGYFGTDMIAHFVGGDITGGPTTFGWNSRVGSGAITATQTTGNSLKQVDGNGKFAYWNNGNTLSGNDKLQVSLGSTMTDATGWTMFYVLDDVTTNGAAFEHLFGASDIDSTPGSTNRIVAFYGAVGNSLQQISTGVGNTDIPIAPAFDLVTGTAGNTKAIIIYRKTGGDVFDTSLNNTNYVVSASQTFTYDINFCAIGNRTNFPADANSGVFKLYDFGFINRRLTDAEVDQLYNVLGVEYFVPGASVTEAELDVGLNTLDDVTLTAPSANETLVYNGTDWVNTSALQVNPVTGKVTIPGTLDPVAFELTPTASLPPEVAVPANTIWVDSGSSEMKIGTDVIVTSGNFGNNVVFGDLGDVDVAKIADDMVPVYNSANPATSKYTGKLVTLGGPTDTTKVQLGDSTVASAVQGDMLSFQPPNSWVNRISNDGQVKVNGSGGADPTFIGLTSPPQIVDYGVAVLDVSSFPTTSNPLNAGTFVDTQFWDSGNKTIQENQVLGQVNIWRIICNYSNKQASNAGVLTWIIRNTLSGFVAKGSIPLPQGITGETDRYTEIITIADGASLKAPLGTGQGYQLEVESSTSVDVVLTSLTRINPLYTARS